MQQPDLLYRKAFLAWVAVVAVFFVTTIFPIAILAVGHAWGFNRLLTGRSAAALVAFSAVVVLILIEMVWLFVDRVNREYTGVRRLWGLRLLRRRGCRALRFAHPAGLALLAWRELVLIGDAIGFLSSHMCHTDETEET